jgi:hypothetical protein
VAIVNYRWLPVIKNQYDPIICICYKNLLSWILHKNKSTVIRRTRTVMQFNLKVVTILIYFLFITLHIFAAFHLQINLTNRKAKISKLSIAYSLILGACILCFYQMSQDVLSASVDFSMYNGVSLIVATLEMALQFLLQIVLLFLQLWNSGKIVAFSDELLSLHAVLNEFRPLSMKRAVVLTAMKLGVSLCLLLLTTIIEFSTNTFITDPNWFIYSWATFIVYYPTILMVCVNCIIFAGLNSLKMCLQHFNRHLETEMLNFGCIVQKSKYHELEECCRMSELIDRLCKLYFDLNCLHKKFQGIFEVPIASNFLFSFLVLVNQVSIKNGANCFFTPQYLFCALYLDILCLRTCCKDDRIEGDNQHLHVSCPCVCMCVACKRIIYHH